MINRINFSVCRRVLIGAALYGLLYVLYTHFYVIAAAAGATALLENAHNRGENLSQKTAFGVTPVVAAARFGQLHTLERLLELGAHDAGGDYNNRPLAYHALEHMNWDVLRSSRVKAVRDMVALEEAVKDIEILSVGDFPSFNGSIENLGSDYLLTYRTHYDVKRGRRPGSFISVQKLNKRFDPVGMPSILNCAPYCEDPRIFTMSNHQQYVIFNREREIHDGGVDKKIQRIALSALNKVKEHYYFDSIIDLASPVDQTRWEKNWTPFEHEGNLKLIYEFEPMTVIQPNMQTGKIISKTSTHVPLHWNYGSVRGGSQAYPYGKYYISFFHSLVHTPHSRFNKPYYHMGAVLFEKKAPFKPLFVTKHPIGVMKLYEASGGHTRSEKWLRKFKIIFPAGLAIRGDTAFVSFGFADELNKVATIDLKKLVQAMEPLGKERNVSIS